MPTISILVPTFNRADKLLRLLKNIEEEITDAELENSVYVIVSDNASTDNTKSIVLSFNATKYNLLYFEQKKNLGFDGNIKFLYDKADTDYVWLFADDDILLAGAIRTVMDALKMTEADALLFSFIQPPDSPHRTFELSEKFAIISDPKEIIKYIDKCYKMSVYIYRKIKLSEIDEFQLNHFRGNCFLFIGLCLTVISLTANPRLCVISQPLATCDSEYGNIRFGADVYLKRYTVAYHPYILRHAPNMLRDSRIQSYLGVIQLMFSIKMGSLSSENPDILDRDIANLRIMPVALLRSPRGLVQFMLLKFKLIYIFKIYKKILSNLKGGLIGH